ncbi:MAG: ATP-dependent DNA ligase [Dermatophilaceae bacterium]
MPVMLAEVVAVSRTVAATRPRTAKTAALAEVFGRCDHDEIGLVVSYLSGTLPQRRLGVGVRSLHPMPDAAPSASLAVADVDATFEVLATASGAGSASVRRAALAALLATATADEQRFLAELITGNLRQGAGDGVVLAAIAVAYAAPEPVVRRAAMLAGFTSAVAEIAAGGGVRSLEAVRLTVGRPLRPMLAASAKTTDAAVASLGATAAIGATASAAAVAALATRDPAVEFAAGLEAQRSSASVVGGDAADDGAIVVDGKLDGIRVQVHRRDGAVTVFTRSLDDITDRVPEVVEAVAGLPGGDLVLDGEAIVIRRDGRPAPFQVTGARTASSADVSRLRVEVPLTTYLFDVVHAGGRDLVDEPLSTRHEVLVGLAPHLLVPRMVTSDAAAVRRFFDELVASGHEGVVVKAASAPYAAGRRGSGWVKVKPVHTVDLVVLAVEWGSGRRASWLSNIHVGARDSGTGELVMVGKTFKGMTDEMLQWQTERFTDLAVRGTGGWVVQVRPEQVVEVAFDGVQTSTRYPGGIALRFARVIRYRDDKPPAEADTMDTLQARLG